jgi:intracellular septation protein
MKFLFDLFPVILFFVTYKLASSNAEGAASLATLLPGSGIGSTQVPILLATAVAIVATFLQVGWLLLRRRKVDVMLWVSLAIIVLLGGATLLLHDKTFIMWKPTVLYWLFATVLLGAKIFFNRNLIRVLMEKQKIVAPEPVWQKLNLTWICFFTTLGFVNLYVAYNYKEETWVNFKLFGVLGIMLVFIFLQGIWLAKHIEHKEESH